MGYRYVMGGSYGSQICHRGLLDSSQMVHKWVTDGSQIGQI